MTKEEIENEITENPAELDRILGIVGADRYRKICRSLLTLMKDLEDLQKASLDYQQESNPVGQEGYEAEEALIKLLPNHPRKQEERDDN